MNTPGMQKASADPTKRFFVEMITRDITLEDSILDLIDNSVDSAWRNSGSPPLTLDDSTDLSQFSISIFASESSFSIRDNCGGMTLDDAVNHAFNFGRRSDVQSDEYSIGVYGIGMKRAIFKIGRQICIRSTFVENDGLRMAFSVPIDVTKWIESDDPPWDFEIDECELQEENGVIVEVKKLTSGAAASFANPAFIRRLERMIARDYALHMERGLNIRVNDKRIPGARMELLQSHEFVPMREHYDDKSVSVEIVGGMAQRPLEGSEPEDIDSSSREYDRFGWYVACNGRIVLAADKTTVSGWGLDNWPKWHPQYAGFLGIVVFSARDASALPLTTTKRSVDVTSDVFLRARPKMRELTKRWTSYTNERKQALDEAKGKERMADAVPIGQVKRRAEVTLPNLIPVSKPRMSHVNYSVTTERMKNLAIALGKSTMTNRNVGIKSFDYTYDDLVGGE
ncbi:ATP-binding protein [Candidatus Foliamicus sp.]